MWDRFDDVEALLLVMTEGCVGVQETVEDWERAREGRCGRSKIVSRGREC